MKLQTETAPSVNRSPNPSVGWVPFFDICQLFQIGTHDVSTDMLPEDEFYFSEVDLSGRFAEGDMFIVEVDKPNGWARKNTTSMSSDDIEGYLEPECLSEEIIEF